MYQSCRIAKCLTVIPKYCGLQSHFPGPNLVSGRGASCNPCPLEEEGDPSPGSKSPVLSSGGFLLAPNFSNAVRMLSISSEETISGG